MWKLNDQFFTSRLHQLTFFYVSGGKGAFCYLPLIPVSDGFNRSKGQFLFTVPLVFRHTSQPSRAKKKRSNCRKKNEEVKE